MVMADKNKSRIFREVLAALIGSKLSSRELRELSDLLASDHSFAYELGRSVYDLSKAIDPQATLFTPEEVDVVAGSDEGLVSLVYNVIQRKRLAKRELINLMRSTSSRAAGSLTTEMSSRELLDTFFDRASTAHVRELLSYLGMNISEDPYLGGIANRSKR